MIKKKTLLITGSTGMVGRNLLEHPAASNWDILLPSSGELDLTDGISVTNYVALNRPDLVIHSAGLVGGIQANINNPVSFLERNISIGRNIIMASYKCQVKNLLNLASTCMYPRVAKNPLREELILTGELEPTNEGYALAKIVTTRLCQYIRMEDSNFQYKTIIPCNLYGRYDKFDPENSHLLPAIIHKIHHANQNNKKTVEIWGNGLARREFMYAGDLADAITHAANDISLLPDLMNCGHGNDCTINEYYETAADVIGWDGDFVHNINQPVGMKQKLCSTDRQNKWGWSPKTSLRDGITATYDFYLNEVRR